MRRNVEGCYDRARRMQAANRERLESLSRALLERETLDEDDAYRAAGFDRDAAADVESTAEETDSAELPAG